jgi:hypothetical protein
VFHSHGEGVEKDQNNDKPIEPLLFDSFSDHESNLFFVHPEIRVFLELFLERQSGSFFLLKQLLK